MWRDVFESVHLKRAETNFRLLFLACETLQFSLVTDEYSSAMTVKGLSPGVISKVG